ncbi:MAG: hypothetical protein ACRDQH_13685, partial [Pseudonocardiaceae bacterium]
VPQQRLSGGEGAAFVQPPLDLLQACPVCRAEVPVDLCTYSGPVVAEHRSIDAIPLSGAVEQDTWITQELDSTEGEINRPDADGAAVLGLIEMLSSPGRTRKGSHDA